MLYPRLIHLGKQERGNTFHRLDGMDRTVHGRKRLDFFACLHVAAYEGQFLSTDEHCTNGDTGRVRQLVRRLRKDFQTPYIIESARKAYRLIIPPEEILILPEFWYLPPGVIDPKLLKLLRVAHDNFWRRSATTND